MRKISPPRDPEIGAEMKSRHLGSVRRNASVTPSSSWRVRFVAGGTIALLRQRCVTLAVLLIAPRIVLPADSLEPQTTTTTTTLSNADNDSVTSSIVTSTLAANGNDAFDLWTAAPTASSSVEDRRDVVGGFVATSRSTSKGLSAAGGLEDFYAGVEHMYREYPCRRAQARTLLMEALLVAHAEPLLLSQVVTPHIVVLHRCDSETGCCRGKKQRCQMLHQQIVPITVLIFNHLTEKSKLRTYMFLNHTECSCQ